MRGSWPDCRGRAGAGWRLEETVEKTDIAIKWTAQATLAATFVLMCVVRMWWTMFLLFGLAFVVVIVFGSNRFCSDFCPMGALQDFLAQDGAPVRRRIRGVRIWKYLLIPLFWGATLGSTFLYRHNPPLLWVWMLRIMISMFFLSMVTQMFLGRRFFCVHLCPLRNPVLEPVRRLRRFLVAQTRASRK